jgi:hypothetical protein
MFDRKEMIQALKKGEATPEQQRDAACLMILLHQGVHWERAEELYLSLKVSNMAGEYTPKGGGLGDCRVTPT